MTYAMLSDAENDAIATANEFGNSGVMFKRTPALFAKSAHPKMSDSYAFTNTYDIVLHMCNRGYVVTSVAGGHTLYTKVMVRMRHQSLIDNDVAYAPELVLLDSHDGSSRLKLYLGFITMACMNGMICGDMLYSQSFLHVAPDLMAQVMLEVDDIGTHINRLTQHVDAMRSYQTNIGERIKIADVGVLARFGDDRSGSFVADMRDRMLVARRSEDNNDSLFSVVGRVQENALRGGMSYNSNNTVRRLASIRDVRRNVSINQRLWQAADELLLAA